MKFTIALSEKQAKKKKVAIDNFERKGLFIWICTCGSVDRIVGKHKKRGWIADYCYNTKRHWLRDLFKADRIILTRYI